jgi:hypothetical protein
VSIAYQHRMGAHCESGTVTGLLRHAGMPISEAMVFGVSGAIFFGYLDAPFLPFPTFVLRNQPGKIRRALARHLGLRFREERFDDPSKGMAALDAKLDRGIPVAAQVDYFYMDYLPEYTRAHFNAHFIVVFGRENGRYLVSDSYFPEPAWLDADTLRRARFARGKFAPRGLLFHPEAIPAQPDLPSAIRRGIRRAAFYMLRLPVPFIGVRGIRRFAEAVTGWPKLARDEEHLSHQVMMIHIILEERGTGGGGFRYLYAAFLQEAAGITGDGELAEISGAMMENGDRWRDVSLFVARIGRKRDLGPERLGELRDLILAREGAEREIFSRLARKFGTPPIFFPVF